MQVCWLIFATVWQQRFFLNLSLSLSAIMPKCSQSVHGTVYLFSYQNQPYSCYLSLLPGISVIVMIWTTQIQGEKLLWKLMWFRFFPMIILVIFLLEKLGQQKRKFAWFLVIPIPNQEVRYLWDQPYSCKWHPPPTLLINPHDILVLSVLYLVKYLRYLYVSSGLESRKLIFKTSSNSFNVSCLQILHW